MRSSKQVRVFGSIQLLTGLFLLIFMAALTFYLAPLMLNGGDDDTGTRFTGTPGQAKIILVLFGLVMAFGAGSSLNGLWQIVSGRTNKWLAISALLICGVLFVFANSLELIFEW